MAGSDIRASFEVESMVRGYHCYSTIWNAVIGEELPCKLELSNPEDRFAVAVCKREITVGHVPKRISSICSSFLRREGTITCRVTGARRYSADLPQGGLEIPCQLHFEGNSKDIDKAKNLLQYTKEICNAGPESKEAREQSTVIISKSPRTLVCINDSSNSKAAVNVEQSHNSLIKITNSLCSSVKVDKSPGCSVKVNKCASAHVKVTDSDCSVVNVSTCSSLSNESSNSPTDTSVDLTYLPANASESKDDPTNVQSVDLTKSEPANISSAKSNNVILLGNHCKRTTIQPKDQRKKHKNFLPNDEELGKIIRGDDITDYSINSACKLLKQQFPSVKGLSLTLYQRKQRGEHFVKDCIQIVHSRGNHWIVASTMKCEDEVLVFDSLNDDLDDDTKSIIQNLFSCENINMATCQKQVGPHDCGLFSIANATAIVNGIEPTSLTYKQEDMRLHLIQCLKQGMLTVFPCTVSS